MPQQIQIQCDVLLIAQYCHPGLDPGSGFDPLSGGRRTVDWLTAFINVQRVLAPKRTAAFGQRF